MLCLCSDFIVDFRYECKHKNYENGFKWLSYYPKKAENISFSKLMSIYLLKLNLKVLNKFDPKIPIFSFPRNLSNNKWNYFERCLKMSILR